MLDGKTLLITGGTGSFGQSFVKTVIERYTPKRLIIFSRDELKQFEMQSRFPKSTFPFLRYFIGDVRDKDRLYRAFDGVDIVIHAAALKQVDTCEYNPLEAVKTNIVGTANVIDAAIDRDVSRVIGLSTDKAANPVNLYGATKLCSDKLFISGNNLSGQRATRFGVVRYGNVVASRGSVIPVFLNARESGVLPITDERMTRFWITLDQAVEFVLKCLTKMQGGETFVPKLPSLRITDLAYAIAPGCRLDIKGIRPGEKLHEVMVPRDDARYTLEFADSYTIFPSYTDFQSSKDKMAAKLGGKTCQESFEYRSDTNSEWLDTTALKDIVRAVYG